ncbi:MAG: Nitrogen transcription regulator, NmrA family [Pseudonocardiales bacterium]|nr:Nitrogen transcription regulator, NmrA family [Pseudonocardiales bacterium]
MTTIAVTGSTGQLGGRVARLLADAGVAQRLVVRDPARAPSLPGADVAQAAFDDPAAVRTALAGVDTVLMVSASETPDRVAQHVAFIDAAVAAGVRHLVYVSFAGASPTATFTLARDHWATERHIASTGVAWTFLRDNLYADFLPAMVGEDGVLRGPAGDGRVAAVAQDDIAAVAALVLRDPSAHSGATHDLTGPEALTLAEVAATISEATGRTVSYHPETVEEAYASRAAYGAPDWQVDAWVSTYTAIAARELAAVSSVIPSLLGRPATSFADVLRAATRSGTQNRPAPGVGAGRLLYLWVEVAGIEPASFVALAGLLRAEFAMSLLGPTGHTNESGSDRPSHCEVSRPSP